MDQSQTTKIKKIFGSLTLNVIVFLRRIRIKSKFHIWNSWNFRCCGISNQIFDLFNYKFDLKWKVKLDRSFNIIKLPWTMRETFWIAPNFLRRWTQGVKNKTSTWLLPLNCNQQNTTKYVRRVFEIINYWEFFWSIWCLFVIIWVLKISIFWDFLNSVTSKDLYSRIIESSLKSVLMTRKHRKKHFPVALST